MSSKLILASTSPQRKKILMAAGIEFIIEPSYIEEPDPATFQAQKARSLVMSLALKKARCIAKKYPGQNYFVLGADTLVVAQNQILGKPENIDHAQKMLSMLSGNWQRVLTGVCVINCNTQRAKTVCQTTRLRLKKMDETTIKRLATQNLDKSGSYAVQDIQDQFLEKIVGDIDNVIGLPMRAVHKLLETV